jgi:lipid A 4'-phosphatase
MAAAIGAGSIAGLVRMGESRHFLSDVVFAGVFMALDVALMYWLVFHVLARRTRDEAWWHEKTLAVSGELRRKSADAVAGGRYWLGEKFPATFGANFAAKDRPEKDDERL